MKLIGQEIETAYTRPFILRRANGNNLTFQLSPLPLSFQSSLRKRGIVPPPPPIKVTRDSTGKPIRDVNGQAITHLDQNDPEYLNNVELYHQRVAVLAVYESLRDDTSIKFETSPPPAQGWGENRYSVFADAIFDEFESSGFTSGDLIAFCNEICKLSNLLDDHLRESQQNFSLLAQQNST